MIRAYFVNHNYVSSPHTKKSNCVCICIYISNHPNSPRLCFFLFSFLFFSFLFCFCRFQLLRVCPPRALLPDRPMGCRRPLEHVFTSAQLPTCPPPSARKRKEPAEPARARKHRPSQGRRGGKATKPVHVLLLCARTLSSPDICAFARTHARTGQKSAGRRISAAAWRMHHSQRYDCCSETARTEEGWRDGCAESEGEGAI